VQKALEEARQKGKIGKSLEATVYIESNEKLHFSKEEMELFLVVSQVEFGKAVVESISTIKSESYSIEIVLPKETECPRCWKHSREKSENGLCKRCDEAIK
jgi:isoleucyl-tRNA synthetase